LKGKVPPDITVWRVLFLDKDHMETKLYVGNLPYSATEDSLRELFSQAGEVTSVTLIKDRDTGQSKGFGFIEMKNQEAMEAAIKQFNEYKLDERALKVNIAKPREERPRNRY
jgi:RNA recognition motif-containing protein